MNNEKGSLSMAAHYAMKIKTVVAAFLLILVQMALRRLVQSVTNRDMIIGLTGKNCAGKGEVAKFLQGIGFAYYSLSDVLRDEMVKDGVESTRDNLIAFGNNLRAHYGAGVLAERVLANLDPEKNYIIDSIRSPYEVDTLRRRKDFSLICIEADSKIRFERIKSRKRPGDPTTFEDFLRVESAEAGSKNHHAQQLNKVAEMANAVIYNENTLTELGDKVREVIRAIATGQERPDWNTYFMDIAKVVALRSNCIKRKVAAVIVKDKRIISTGYNGTPRGIKNCNEGGCPRCNSLGESGANLDTCICSHAEENAIVQSAYHGMTIKGSTIYSTFSPCLLCTKMIINSGIIEVVFQNDYPLAKVSLELLKEAGIKVTTMEHVPAYVYASSQDKNSVN